MNRCVVAASVALICAASASGCYLSHERAVDASVDARTPVAASLVWVLVHPSDAPRGAGLYLFDEGDRRSSDSFRFRTA